MRNLIFILFFVTGLNAQNIFTLQQQSLLKSSSSEPEIEAIVGKGSGTTGGAGGTSYVVSNLNDSGTGSFREAVEASGARIVTFSVSGVIELSSTLTVSNNNITIDGSSAPNGGICLKGQLFQITASEVLIRFMRFRLGDNGYKNAAGTVVGSDSADRDCVSIDGSSGAISNIVLQNCSFSWSIDELLEFWTNGITGNINNVTIQRCLFTEALYNSHHSSGVHAMSVLMNGATNVTFYKNYFAHSSERHLRTQAETTFELVNNVFYNTEYNGVYGHGSDFDIINNHFKEGNNPFIDNKITSNAADGSFLITDTDCHITGNTNDGGLTEVDSDLVARQQGSTVLASTITPDTNDAAMITDILNNCGATLPARDSVDARVVLDYTNNTGSIIDTQEQVGGYPTYN